MKRIIVALLSTSLLVISAVDASSHGMPKGMGGDCMAQNAKQHAGHMQGHGKHGGHKKMAMKHANPMPNLMKVVSKFGDELGLDQEQAAALKKWRDENHAAVQQLAQDVMQAEHALHSAALTDASQAELQDLMDEVLSARLQIANRKMSCRENMRGILNSTQWNKLVDIYSSRIGR